MMIDTLSSSLEFRSFDSDRKSEVGFRLPADPYWLSPPQGSIVPVWHDGGAPNYQPKPMICRHVQDTVQAWKRETPEQARKSQKGLIKTLADAQGSRPCIRIFSCSAGVNAGKMARKLHGMLKRLVFEVDDPFDVEQEKSLNQLDLHKVGTEDIILIIASTTGRGETPRNAKQFIKRYISAEPLTSPPRFSCFANGDSTYGDTYNAAGKSIQDLMTKMGCRPLLGHCFAGDTSLHNPDWDSFTQWVENIDHLILGNHHKIELPTSLSDVQVKSTTLNEMPTATLVRIQRPGKTGMVQITLDIGGMEYQEMDHLKVLTPNPDHEVQKALNALGLSSETKLDWHHQDAGTFLNRYVDLDHFFKDLHWYPGFLELPVEKQEELKTAKILTVLETLQSIEDTVHNAALIEKVFKSMPSIVPRLYSVASCPVQTGMDVIQEEGSGNVLDVLVKINPGGRFSDAFLQQARPGAQLRFGLTSPDAWKMVQVQKPNAPFIAIATGSGIGPVRALLQRRIFDISRTAGEAGRPRAKKATYSTGAPSVNSGSRRGSVSSIGSDSRLSARPVNHHAHLGVTSTRKSVSLLVGFKSEDADLIQQVIRPASHAGILNVVELCQSNEKKVRIQDHILLPHVKEKLAAELRDPACIVFVCANESAAEASVVNLSIIMGVDVKDALGERYIEEIFRN
jgi:sulfite reductase alpha subunit-like flavoprotein